MKKIFMLLSLFFLLLFSGEVLAEGIDSYTTLMLHFNESDASFADSSPQNNTLTNNGVAYTSAGKYSGAGVFNGYDMSIPYNAALNPGTGDFSIDAQVKFTSLDSYYNTLIGQAGTGAMIVHLFSDGTLKLGVSNMGYQSQCSLSTSTLTDGNYHHLEISRTSGVVYMFLDGQSQTVSGSGNTTNYVFLSALNVITVGSQNGVNLWSTGNIDELRFQTGQGGHTANFIPPSAPWGYGINSNTKLMLHLMRAMLRLRILHRLQTPSPTAALPIRHRESFPARVCSAAAICPSPTVRRLTPERGISPLTPGLILHH